MITILASIYIGLCCVIALLGIKLLLEVLF